MSERIRFRVWLAGLGPIALVLSVVVYLVVRAHDPAARRAPPGPSAASELAAPTSAAPPPAAAVATAPQSALASGSTSRPAAAGPSRSPGDPPEPVPEVDALFWRPRGSEQWTADQRDAYRRKVLEDLDARERTLESEVAAARRNGDTETEQRKTATLSYLRERRAQAEEMMRMAREAGAPAARAGGSEREQKFDN